MTVKEHRITQHIVVVLNDERWEGVVHGDVYLEGDILEEGDKPQRSHLKSYLRHTEGDVLTAVRQDHELGRLGPY